MSVSDARAVAETRTRSWQHAYRGLMPQRFLDGMRPERFAARLRDTLSTGGSSDVNLVADAHGLGVIGWASFGPYRPIEDLDHPSGAGEEVAGSAAGPSGWGELYALYLRPEYMGRGIGRVLVTAALEGLADRGHQRARLWVPRDHVPARRFYERAGFAADGAESVLKMADEPVTEVRYQRALVSAA